MKYGGKWLERSVRRRVAVIVVFSLILGILPVGEASVSRAAEGQSRSSSLRNPRVSGGVTTWDCIYFGRYWQNDTNGDGKADQDDVKEVIKWRVLSVDGDDAFLVADRNLDCQQYNDSYESATWETSTLREWLNNSFFNNAFSVSEQSAIKSTQVINSDNPDYGTEGGSDTTDQVYLLSIDEVTNGDYGFSVSSGEYAKSRRALNTAYAKEQGAYTNTDADYEGNGMWCLRSPGCSSSSAAIVHDNGSVDRYGRTVDIDFVAVRPVLYLNLSSVSEWSLAGTVASDGTEINPTDYPMIEPTPDVTLSPSTNPPYADLQNPRVSDGVTTWDCLYFGNYWQNDTNGDGTADRNDAKEPIKWRVLSVDGDDAFLMADQNLDCQKYNYTYEEVTWETSALRAWLNHSFLEDAFSSQEQSLIKNTRVMNSDNPVYGTEGGNNTTDQVFVLSIDEATDSYYGFSNVREESEERRKSLNTAYAKEQGAYISMEFPDYGFWWLRSPGNDNYSTTYVKEDGYMNTYGDLVYRDDIAVRPVLHINLSVNSAWSLAGTAASDGTVTEPSVRPTESPKVTPLPSTNPPYADLQNPRVSDGVTTWDCIYFGNYWQNDTNGDGTADQDDDKEPIKWRVLSVDGDDAFLVADQNLDCQQYNDSYENATWETSTLREWLNDSFFNNAFSASEQSAIKSTQVINSDHPDYGTEGGSDTTDQVYLLSIDEVTNGDYGFSVSSGEYAKSRRALNTAYAKEQGAYTNTNADYEGNGMWWLRSPGDCSDNAARVDSHGDVNRYGHGVINFDVGVRPALHLNLSSVSEWSPAGTVVSDEVVIEPTPTIKPTPNVTKTPSPTPKVTIIPSVKPTQIPTHKPEIDETSTPTSKPEATVSATPTKVPTTKPEVGETPTPTSKPEASAPAITTAAPGADVTPTPTIRPGSDITPTPKPGTSQTQPQVSTKPSEKPSSGSDGTVIPPNQDIPSAINPDIISKNDDSGGEKQSVSKREVTPGKIVTVFGLQYKIKKSTQKERTVVLWKVSNKKIKKATIPNSIKIQSASYKIVEISKNAFKGCKQLQTATIGKEVRIIGNGAFSGCRKIKKVIIRSKVLKKIGKGAFAGVSRKAKIQVPKSKVAQYRKLMKKG